MPAKPKTVVARFNMWAMSNFRPQDTGVLGAIVWVSTKEAYGKAVQHSPRLKVMLGTKLTHESLQGAATVTLLAPSRVIGKLPATTKRQALQFIALNRDILLQYWEFEIGTPELVRGIRRP